MGPTAYSPYPRRLECLSFADCKVKAAHSLSYFNTQSVGLPGMRLEPVMSYTAVPCSKI